MELSAGVSKQFKTDAGAGLCWREAHLVAKAPWMSPRPGEDEEGENYIHTPLSPSLTHKHIYISLQLYLWISMLNQS